jgi:thiamine biosynthesis protein ThiS
MQLLINGKDQALENVTTAADVLAHLNIARERVAVVVNEQVVRRANLESTPLNDGDVIEIITMVGGG